MLMNFNKPNAVVYITPNSVIVAGKKLPPTRLTLGTDIMSNLEIINPEKFRAACKRFFESRDLKGRRVLILLDPRATFNKVLPLDKLGNPRALTEAFVAAMPFERGQRGCVTVNSGNQLNIYATNAQLYQLLADAIRLTGHTKVVAATPAAAYDLSTIEKTFSAALTVYLKDDHLTKLANFLDTQPY